MYRIFDIALECDLALPELPEIETVDRFMPVVRISAGKAGGQSWPEMEWFHEWQDNRGRVNTICGRAGDEYVLRFPNLVDFVISIHGNHIVYESAEELPVETLRHLLIDQVIPRFLGQKGKIILHASAVHFPGQPAIIFVGDTGQGKSTLASFCYSKGMRLITDDCLMLDITKSPPVCIPNYSGLRLFDDSSRVLFGDNRNFKQVSHYSGKKRLILHTGESMDLASIEAGVIFLLGIGSKKITATIDIEKMHGSDELISIIRQLFILDVEDRDNVSRQFANARQLVEDVPIFKLAYPREYPKLDDVYNVIESALEQCTINQD